MSNRTGSVSFRRGKTLRTSSSEQRWKWSLRTINHQLGFGKIDGSLLNDYEFIEKESSSKHRVVDVVLLQLPNNQTIKFDNSTETEDERLIFTKLQYRLLPQILAFILLLFYLIILLRIIRHFTKLHNSFYTFVVSLGIVDIICLMVNSVEPRRWDAVNREPNFWFYAFLVQFLWYCGIFNVLGLTVSRFVIIFWHQTGEKILSKRNLLLGIVFIWLSGFGLAAPVLSPSQHWAKVDQLGRVHYWNLSSTYFLVESIASILCIALSMALYVLMFFKARFVKSNLFRHQSQTSETRRRSFVERDELKILLQSFILTSCMTLCLFNDYIHYVTNDQLTMFAYSKITVLLNYGIAPFLYLIFSSQVRNLFCLSSSSGFRSGVSAALKSGSTNGFSKKDESVRQKLLLMNDKIANKNNNSTDTVEKSNMI